MSSDSSIQVVVRHHDRFIAMGLAAALAEQPGIDVGLAEEPDFADVLVADPDSALAWQADRAQRSVRPPATRVVVVTDRPRECEVREALSAGFHGFLTLGGGEQALVNCVRMVSLGHRHLCSQAADCIAESMTHESLTQRESAVLRLVVKGHPNKLIAHELEITVGTVKTHVKAILGKLNARTRTHAAALAAERGLVR